MKKHWKILILFLITFSACEGSDSYQGNWKALDSNGEKCEITFSPNTISIKESSGKANDYEYTQNRYSSENSIETYGIQLNDGRVYQIYFPKKDKSVALILGENGKQLYTISRSKFLTYEEIYSLN